jgi:hypothetical protein
MGSLERAASWDVYREIHKAMRYALFGVTTLAGSTDAADAAALQRLGAEWDSVVFVLGGHHVHEDRYCDPLIQRHAPSLRDELETAHRASDAAIARLQDTARQLQIAPDTTRQALLRQFHLDLADFTADYISHLRFEEDRVMPALNAALNDAELAEVTRLIRTSVPPAEMCIFIRYMVPAMNFAERLDMLGGMHEGAPPEIFELFRAAAQACLPEDDYRAVAVAARFA